jgi:hypothetical protein
VADEAFERHAIATEAWAILHRHPLDREVAGDSVHASVSGADLSVITSFHGDEWEDIKRRTTF